MPQREVAIHTLTVRGYEAVFVEKGSVEDRAGGSLSWKSTEFCDFKIVFSFFSR